MNATGLKTAQSGFGGNIMRALLAAVVLAAMVSVLIVGATGNLPIGSPVAAPAPAVVDAGLIALRAAERADEQAALDKAVLQSGAAVGHPKWISPDRGEPTGAASGATSGSYHSSKQIPNR